MEHARKMVLVPHDNVERLQNALANTELRGSILKTVQTPGCAMTRLDAEMSNILNSSSCKSEREKWAQYRAVLQRYLYFRNADGYDKVQKREKETKMKINDGDDDNNHNNNDNEIQRIEEEEEEEQEEEEEEEDQIDANIVESVPKKFRRNAGQLLRQLRVSGNIVWDRKGAVKIGGKTVRSANMFDLVNDAMRNRKNSTPPGHEEFAVALRESFVPLEFIGNK